MLWLKARSLMALGMTTATRKGSPVAGAAVGSSVAGIAPQALRISVKVRIRLKNHTDFFIFFSLNL
jgi:hypothetical protein